MIRQELKIYKFTLNILPVISNVNSYIDQRFEYFKSSISDLPINNDLNNMNEGILYALNEIRVKVDALSPSDKMVFAQTLQANLSANIPITVLNSSKARKNNTFDPLKLIFNEANASDISVTNKMRNFVIVGIISIKYAVPAIQKGALLIKTSKSTPKRLAGAALIVGGLATIALFIYTEWDILEGLNFLDAETITFNVLGSSAYADEPINIKLKGIFRPINPILDSNSKSSLIKNTINTYNNANTFLLSIDNILSSVNGAMANLSIISPLPEKTQKLKFDQKTVESNLSPKFITSAIVISPLDGSASVSIQPNVGVVIKSNKSQLVKVRLMYDNINLAITKSIDVVLPVVATEIIVPKAIIHYTKNNLQVNFDSADPVSPNISGLTFFWSFGDGQNQTTTSKNISHNYSHEGNYVVTLTVTNASGASANSQANVQVASPIDVSPIPHATIAYSTYKYQANFDATDSQNSAVVGISYQWDYGDGNSETFPVPTVTHYYQNAGKYNVTLKAIDYFGKTATVTRSVLIAGELPVISHTTAGREVTFTLTDSLNIAEMGAIYKWTFSDGESLSTTSKQVIHLFPDLLGKIISVELFDENSTLIYSITDTLPDRSHSNLSYVIINRNVKFNLESILGYDNEPGITYSWDFGDGNQGTSLGTSIVHTYFNEGTYHVTVNVFDKNGNLLFNETTFVLVDQSNQSINAQAVLADGTSGEAYLISLFSPTSKIGFNYQYDSLYEGTCYVKGFVYFTSSLDGKQVVSAPLYNCTANDLILTNN
jgi:PKD repeat protein